MSTDLFLATAITFIFSIINFIVSHWFEILIISLLLSINLKLKNILEKNNIKYIDNKIDTTASIVKDNELNTQLLSAIAYKIDWLEQIWRQCNQTNDEIAELNKNLRIGKKFNRSKNLNQ